jgi:hypothetical protein
MTTVGKFGIELECFNVDMSVVVTALRNVAQVNAHSSSYSGREYSVWQVKYDGSIQGNNGFEVVSPILEGEAGIAEVQKVCDALVAIGAQVNKSCGFHIHHDATGWGIQKFRNLFKRFVKFENALDSVQPESRRGDNNRYCKSIVKTFAQIDQCNTVNGLAMLYDNNRYFKLNLQSFFRQGSVEFRNHAGTVEAAKVINYIRLTSAMVCDAGDKTAVKQFTKPTTAKEALDTMLAGMIRRNRITTETATFYKTRQAKFAKGVTA